MTRVPWLENRDVWEYELNLEPHEIERLLAHTWELGFTRFDYYFFDENCSYHLLSLLDVARPGVELTDPSHLVGDSGGYGARGGRIARFAAEGALPPFQR